ncbi:MAG: PorT family protein [Bacteroidales bacterium]|nr:PorT family protein [Bacteroidales bacterium]
MNQKDLIERYKEQVAASKETAPFDLWPDISRKLDVEEIWDNVSARLDREEKKKPIWLWASWAAVLVGIIFLGSLFLMDINSKNRSDRELAGGQPTNGLPVNAETDEAIDEQVDILKIQAAADSTIIIREAATSSSLLALDEGSKMADNSVDSSSFEYRRQARADDLLAASQVFPEEQNQFKTEYLNLIQLAQVSVDEPGILNKTKSLQLPEQTVDDFFALDGSSPVLSFGLTTAIKNTWLFNQETIDGFNVNVPGKTNLKFFPDLGLNIRYRFMPQWAFEVGAFFSSRTGQSYQQFIYGRFTQKEIALNYMQLELLGSRMAKKSFAYNSTVIQPRTSAGIYLAGLNTASETIGGEREKVIDRYNNNDIGFILGQDFDISLGSNLTLSPGLWLKWGLKNVYAGEAYIPASLKETYNRSIEFRISIDYHLNTP